MIDSIFQGINFMAFFFVIKQKSNHNPHLRFLVVCLKFCKMRKWHERIERNELFIKFFKRDLFDTLKFIWRSFFIENSFWKTMIVSFSDFPALKFPTLTMNAVRHCHNQFKYKTLIKINKFINSHLQSVQFVSIISFIL